MGEIPSSWSVSRLSAWLGQDERMDPETIDALALCDVDGRIFLEMDEEDLAESEELGLDSKSIHTILQLQQKLEEMELAHARGKQPLPTASPTGALVHAVDIPPNRRPHTAVTAVTNSWAESGRPPEGEAGRASSCSSSWSLPCVSVDTEGNSYFTDKKVALGPGTGAGIGALSELFPASGVKFRETPGDYDFDFHTAPAKQFIVSLDAGVEIEVTDGTRRVFPAGTVMLAEDTWGKGHRSRAVNGKSRRSLFVVLPNDFEM